MPKSPYCEDCTRGRSCARCEQEYWLTDSQIEARRAACSGLVPVTVDGREHSATISGAWRRFAYVQLADGRGFELPWERVTAGNIRVIL